MSKAKHPLLVIVAVLLLTACLSAPSTTVAPASSLSSINLTATALVQFLTSVPRVTQVAAQPVPTQTEIVTMTPFPSITPLPTATATATPTPFGFKASSTPTMTVAVPLETPDPDEGATDDWGSPYRCTLMEKSMADWTVLVPNRKYTFSWTLLNSGTKKWNVGTVDLNYISGKNFTKHNDTYSLSNDNKVNETISPEIEIYAPDYPGNYRAVWGLSQIKGGHVFCTFTIKITIK